MLRFARATGDLHSLSTADIRLIALAHTLEVARHGSAALRALPEVPCIRKGDAPAAKDLPGWNEGGEKWADMDRLTEEALAEQELAGNFAVVQSSEIFHFKSWFEDARTDSCGVLAQDVCCKLPCPQNDQYGLPARCCLG